MKCKICKKKLGDSNESGYCVKCYRKSPYYLEYQRNYQREIYYKKNKEKRKIYQQKNKDKIKKYQKKYQKKNKERLKEIKREWARKNRSKNGN